MVFKPGDDDVLELRGFPHLNGNGAGWKHAQAKERQENSEHGATY